jgi:hypothetical protein
MKTFKVLKTASVGYIYSDGHVVIVHREIHPKAGRIEWAEVIEKAKPHMLFTGRLIFHHVDYDWRFRLALGAVKIWATAPTLEAGSNLTKKAGIRVAHFGITLADGGSLDWTLFPELCGDGIDYQPEATDKFNPSWVKGISRWGNVRINFIHKASDAQVAAAA